MKLLVRGINDAVWIAVKTGWEEPTIFTTERKKPKPKEPRQGVVREVVQEVFRRMRHSLMQGEVVTFWSKECISRGGEEHGDGRPESLLHKACGVVGYHVDARYAEMEKDKLRVYVLT
ncbi:hypothetical protein F2Q70_00021126 [Brassica cretica]|uniref:Uncharacterized protein n=1 Tax=Brassica cretica TaxID=69181 RepID=A0A8S9GPX1_BRACR|nr:hypothetical protein F2Q70_00021126 [Brassica cretica]